MQTKMALLGAAALICVASPASAQSYAMDRGVWVVGGSASVSHFEASGSNGGSTGISIYPDVGYFFVPGLLVLANVEYAPQFGRRYIDPVRRRPRPYLLLHQGPREAPN